jgi:hypothetical protein
MGMMLFAVGYSSQRDMFISKANVLAYRTEEVRSRLEAIDSLNSYIVEACGAVVARVRKTQCTEAKTLLERLKIWSTTYQVVEIERSFFELQGNSYTAIRDEYIKSFPEKPPEEAGRAYFSGAARFEVALEFWREAIARRPEDLEVKGPNEEVEVVLGLGQTILWPFLLALALALRITKVTIDVFEWAR